MKTKITLFTLFLLGLITQSIEGKSIIKESCTLKSTILAAERKYAVYLPDGYGESERAYPVLYLLHGFGDDHTAWIQFGDVQRIADKAISEGLSSPMIIVMPNANAGRNGYVNDVKGDFNYEDFFIKELIPHIEKQYRCKSEKQFRAIAGLSMGGGGTLYYALHHPDLFSAACPLSANIHKELDKRPIVARYANFGISVTDEEIDEWYKRYDVLQLVDQIPVDQRKLVQWYIDCGDDDFLYEGNSLLHIAMRKQNIPHEFRVRDGGHGWQYWREALPEVLGFVSKVFRK